MPFQLINISRWFLINLFLHFGFSRCLQVLVHWCGFHAARGESEWCIGAYYCDVLLLKQLLPYICQAAGDLLSSALCVHKSTGLLWLNTPDFTPGMRPPNRPDLDPVDYGIWIIEELLRNAFIINSKCRHTSLWLLTEWHIIFHKVG